MKTHFGLTLVLLLGIVGTAFFKLFPLSSPLPSLPIVQLPTDSQCFLTHAACTREVEQGRITLQIPQPIPLAKPFQAVLHLQNLNPHKITLHLEGADMFMGNLDFVFQPSQKNQLSAQIMVPLCLTGKMRWRATLKIQLAQKEVHLPWEWWTE